MVPSLNHLFLEDKIVVEKSSWFFDSETGLSMTLEKKILGKYWGNLDTLI
jgi:hypothetical protein